MRDVFNQFDLKVTVAIQAWPDAWRPWMLTATFLGLPAVLIGGSAMGAVIAWRYGARQISYAFMASIAALFLNSLLKLGLHRVRPDTLYVSQMRLKSYSFPSGHAFGGLVFYGLIAYLALVYLPQPWGAMIAAGCIALILLIGLSRVYLGAHFPTDVIGGWVIGALALWLIIRIIKP